MIIPIEKLISHCICYLLFFLYDWVGLSVVGKHVIGLNPLQLNKLNTVMDTALRGHPYVKSAIGAYLLFYYFSFVSCVRTWFFIFYVITSVTIAFMVLLHQCNRCVMQFYMLLILSFTPLCTCIDVACWDILGKVAGLPVCELLGGRYGKKRNSVWLLWQSNLLWFVKYYDEDIIQYTMIIMMNWYNWLVCYKG